MAKYERTITGDFDGVLRRLHDGVMNGSASASYEDGSDYRSGDFRCAVRVYERYSWSGGNRVSMSMTLAGRGDELFLSAITSGGSQAMFFKVNTWGEENFLDTLRELIPSLGYLEEQSLVVQVTLGDDNYWSLNEDDFNNLDWLIIDYNF